MTQEQLADRAFLHRNHVSLLERGRVAVVLDTVEQLAAALGVSVGVLFAEVDADVSDADLPDLASER